MKLIKKYKFIANYIKQYSGTIFNATVVALTGGIEQLTTLAVYRCPCFSPSELSIACSNATASSLSCRRLLNLGYGLSFIISPAVGLFVLGMVSNINLWKSCTGYMRKSKKQKREIQELLCTLFMITCQAMVSPIAWIAIALLDGRYYACAVTYLPYDVDHLGAQYKDCEMVVAKRNPVTSSAFNDNRSISQILGWIVTASFAVFSFLVYSFFQCMSPLTYYHAKYYKFYANYEEAEFEDEMKKKAQKEAESNVLKFMEKRRSKALWDRISTVYEFHRDKRNLALYSNLHQWVLEEKEREKDKEKAPLLCLDDIDGVKIVSSTNRTPLASNICE